MAKHKQLWLKGSKGKLAGTTFYQTAGVTIQREINYDPSNPRTDKQMTQRTKLANLVNMYRAGKSFFPRAFENKKPLESDYNKFMSYNLTNSPIYLTKGEAAKGIFIPAAYQISQGSLPQGPGLSEDGGDYTVTAVSGGSLSANTTVAEYAQKMKDFYPALEDGDQMSIVGWGFSGGDIHFLKCEIILSFSDTSLLSSKLPNFFSWVPTEGIILSTGWENSAAAVVISRTVAGKTLVSPATLLVYEGEDYTSHVSSAAQAAAINSYGASKKVFLDNK